MRSADRRDVPGLRDVPGDRRREHRAGRARRRSRTGPRSRRRRRRAAPTSSWSASRTATTRRLGKWFDGGVELSGGEWQKVALGRAFMRDAVILVLDEPTSALDAQAEFELFARLRRLAEGRTAVYISHRFSTVRQADRILFLEHGRLVEEGTHEELMRPAVAATRGCSRSRRRRTRASRWTWPRSRRRCRPTRSRGRLLSPARLTPSPAGTIPPTTRRDGWPSIAGDEARRPGAGAAGRRQDRLADERHPGRAAAVDAHLVPVGRGRGRDPPVLGEERASGTATCARTRRSRSTSRTTARAATSSRIDGEARIDDVDARPARTTRPTSRSTATGSASTTGRPEYFTERLPAPDPHPARRRSAAGEAPGLASLVAAGLRVVAAGAVAAGPVGRRPSQGARSAG